jgi:hypothetical protein
VAGYRCGLRGTGNQPAAGRPSPQYASVECVLLATDRSAGPSSMDARRIARGQAPGRCTEPDPRVKAAHGTLSRVGAGCTCPDCRAASTAFQRERERQEAEKQFPSEKRATLLGLLDQGILFMQATVEVGVRPKQVWGRARSDPAWGAELQAILDRARSTDIVHGRQSAYRRGCRCSECRAAR